MASPIKLEPVAHFAIVDTGDGPHVRLIGANGEIVMWSETYADRRDAERVIEIVGEAVGRKMTVRRPGMKP